MTTPVNRTLKENDNSNNTPSRSSHHSHSRHLSSAAAGHQRSSSSNSIRNNTTISSSCRTKICHCIHRCISAIIMATGTTGSNAPVGRRRRRIIPIISIGIVIIIEFLILRSLTHKMSSSHDIISIDEELSFASPPINKSRISLTKIMDNITTSNGVGLFYNTKTTMTKKLTEIKLTVDNNDTTTTTTTTTSNKNISKSDIINALWKGDITPPLSSNDDDDDDDPFALFRRITIVISHCNEDLSWIPHFVTDDQLVSVSKINVTIYTKCQSYDPSLVVNFTNINVHVESVPYVSGSHHAYAYLYWMARMTATTPHPNDDDDDDDVVVFLTGKGGTPTDRRTKPRPDDGSSSTTRSLPSVLRIAHANGFGCFAKPSRWGSGDADLSVYHDSSLLLSFSKNKVSFSSQQKQQLLDARNMSDWLAAVNASLPTPLTPVCYGESFAVRTSLIKTRGLSFWAGMEGRLYRPRGRSTSEGHYMERLWAGLFFSKERGVEGMMLDYATGVSEDDPYRGALLRHEVIYDRRRDVGDGVTTTTTTRRASLVEVNEEAWRGGPIATDASSSRDDDAQPSSSHRDVILVVSHCREDLSWITDFAYGVTLTQTLIFSKCGADVTAPPLHNTTIIRLPNVGRCDHTYAHFMSDYAPHYHSPSTIVIFLKASQVIHQSATPRTLSEMMDIASVNGFGCWLELARHMSAYHDTTLLRLFNMNYYQRVEDRDEVEGFKSNDFESLGEWLDHVGGRLPHPVTQVCYGGTFAVLLSRIQSHPPSLYTRISHTLSRGDNIQEGHYAERSWAGLLSLPLPSSQIPPLLRAYSKTMWSDTNSHPYRGALHLKKGGGRVVNYGVYNVQEETLWKGSSIYGSMRRFEKVFVVVVVMRCETSSLEWVEEFMSGVEVYDISIYSYCNDTTTTTTTTSLSNVTIIPLSEPTTGPHETYARILSGDISPHLLQPPHSTNDANYDIHENNNNHAIVFANDLDMTNIRQWGRPTSLPEMLRLASVTEFACRLKPLRARGWGYADVSVYHNTETLIRQVSTRGSGEETMEHWLSSFGARLPQPFTNVCYGGVFAVKARRVAHVTKTKGTTVWKTMAVAIAGDPSRGNYFAERTWAGLLSPEPSLSDVRYLMKYRRMKVTTGGYTGALLRKDSF